jgi:preprotein translocase subunit SecY
VYVERAQRRLLVQYPKRQVGMRMTGGGSTHLPLKLNSAGVIPPIFAQLLTAVANHHCQCWFGADAPEWLSNTIRALSFGQPLAYGVVRFYDYFL